MDDPGTINSDDEVEIYSDGSDSEEELIDDTTGQDFSVVEKYMKSKAVFNVNQTINNVLEEERSKGRLVWDVNCFLGLKDNQKEIKFNEKWRETKNFDKNYNKKLRRKEREEKMISDHLERDKIELDFEDAPLAQSNVTFEDLNLSVQLLRVVAFLGYVKPTPIQASTIPIALKGRDIFGCAATGTGKTAAFILPIIQRLIFKPLPDEDVTRVLIMVPTRELGIQVFEVAEKAAKFAEVSISLSVGGLDRNTQSKELLKRPDIIIATPGRLIDHIHNTEGFSLRDIEILVVDEADRMLDNFFMEQLSEIIQQCSSYRQTMLFSATMSEKVKDLVILSLKKPVRVFVNNNKGVAQNLSQEFIRLKKKFQTDDCRLAVLAYLLVDIGNEETIVFMQHKLDCHKMRVLFQILGFECGELHADLKQNQRFFNLQKFKKKETKILFSTNVAARGLDIKNVKNVINYTVPNSYDVYIHRVGRTARAGKSGRSITISYDSGRDFSMLRQIQRDSMTPLYERFIDPKHTTYFKEKIKELGPLVEKILKQEREDKDQFSSVGPAEQPKKKFKKQCEDIESGDYLIDLENLRQEKKKLQERMKMLNCGILPPDLHPKKKPELRTNIKYNTNNQKKNPIDYNKKNIPKQIDQNRKNFQKETDYNQKQNNSKKIGNYIKKQNDPKKIEHNRLQNNPKKNGGHKEEVRKRKSFFDVDLNIGDMFGRKRRRRR